jgi:predicted ester cyclase
MSSVDDNKGVVLQFYEQVINRRDPAAIDGLLAEGFVHNGEPRGVDGQRAAIEALFAAMPDMHVETDAIIAEGDLVAVHQTWTGTQTGVFQGVQPTGKRISFTSTAMLRVSGGKIAHAWVNEDDLGLMQQLHANL